MYQKTLLLLPDTNIRTKTTLANGRGRVEDRREWQKTEYNSKNKELTKDALYITFQLITAIIISSFCFN